MHCVLCKALCFFKQYTFNRMDKNVSYGIEVERTKVEKNNSYIAASSAYKGCENANKN